MDKTIMSEIKKKEMRNQDIMAEDDPEAA